LFRFDRRSKFCSSTTKFNRMSIDLWLFSLLDHSHWNSSTSKTDSNYFVNSSIKFSIVSQSEQIDFIVLSFTNKWSIESKESLYPSHRWTLSQNQSESILGNSTRGIYGGSNQSIKSTLTIFGNSFISSNRRYQFMVRMSNKRNASQQATGYLLVRIEETSPQMITIGCVIQTMRVFPISNINLSIQQHKFLCIHFLLPSVQHLSISHGISIKVKQIFHRMPLNGRFSIRFNPMKILGFSVDTRRISHRYPN